jgi:hypothetical protein
MHTKQYHLTQLTTGTALALYVYIYDLHMLQFSLYMLQLITSISPSPISRALPCVFPTYTPTNNNLTN